jgi:hypothetical protein
MMTDLPSRRPMSFSLYTFSRFPLCGISNTVSNAEVNTQVSA